MKWNTDNDCYISLLERGPANLQGISHRLVHFVNTQEWWMLGKNDNISTIHSTLAYLN